MVFSCSICHKTFYGINEFLDYDCLHENHANSDVPSLIDRYSSSVEANFVVVGTTFSGKSYFIYTLLHLLLEEPPDSLKAYMDSINMRIELVGKDAKQQFRRFQALLLSGNLKFGTKGPDKENHVPLNLIIRIGNASNEQKVRLTFFDISGELYDPNKQYKDFMRKQARVHQAKGIIYLFAPFEDMKLYRMLHYDDKDRAILAATYPVYEALYEAIQENIVEQRRRAKVNIPVAFCISQFDLLKDHVPEKLRQPYIEIPDMMNHQQEFRFEKVDYFNREIQQFLKTNSNVRPNEVCNLYSEVSFFAITSIGHDEPSAIPTIGLKPQGILAPLFWLLARHHIIPVVGENHT